MSTITKEELELQLVGGSRVNTSYPRVEFKFVSAVQSMRGTENSGAFIASNGVKIASIDNPEWRGTRETLFIPGKKDWDDDRVISCGAEWFPKIAQAVRELNVKLNQDYRAALESQRRAEERRAEERRRAEEQSNQFIQVTSIYSVKDELYNLSVNRRRSQVRVQGSGEDFSINMDKIIELHNHLRDNLDTDCDGWEITATRIKFGCSEFDRQGMQQKLNALIRH
jgi:hypothetical protein